MDAIVVLPGEGEVLKGSRTGSAVIREAGPALSVLEFELTPSTFLAGRGAIQAGES